jgi:DNA polymerase-1
MAVRFSDTTCIFDIEAHSINERYDMSPREYFRLGQWAYGEGVVHTTTDYDEFMTVIRGAKRLVGQNIHGYDLSVLFGVDSIEPVHMARDMKVLDTLIFATHTMPAPLSGWYETKDGAMRRCKTPKEARSWFSLANLAFQLQVEGKLSDLKELDKKYSHRDEIVGYFKSGPRKGQPKIKRVPIEGLCCGFGNIPTDDPDFIAYAEQDVVAVRNVARALLERSPLDAYAWREQMKAAIDAQITRNGWRTDKALAKARVREQHETAAWILNDLHDQFGFPITGKKPTASDAGKAALLAAFEQVGIKESDLERTEGGGPSFGGDSVKKAAGYKDVDGRLIEPEERTEAVELAEAVGILAGQRSLADLTLASTHSDGKVHPSIQPLQASGRKSTTEPGLTVFDDNHKDYYLPDDDTHVIVGFDFSNADARAVAAMSGDRNFAKRFEPGQDGHLINAIAGWGEAKVLASAEVTAYFRQRAKAPGHGWSYRMGAKKGAAQTGIPEPEMKLFLGNMSASFPAVVKWQDAMSEFGRKHGYVMNDWGRVMPVDPKNAYTQPPALMGQSVTNELLGDGLIKLPDRILRMIKVTIHDAVYLSMPKATLARDIEFVVRCFSTRWKPRSGGQEIEFPVTPGPPGKTWKDAAAH